MIRTILYCEKNISHDDKSQVGKPLSADEAKHLDSSFSFLKRLFEFYDEYKLQIILAI